MKNIINYVEDEKSSFTAKAFNGVDSLILSQVAYLEFDGLVPTLGESCDWVEIKSIVAKKDSKELYRHSNVWLNKRLLVALGESPRFADCKINYYVNIVDYDKEKQFSAVTFKLSNGLIYIAFRGTDSSFVGWKEDFNMAFSNTIPLAGL